MQIGNNPQKVQILKTMVGQPQRTISLASYGGITGWHQIVTYPPSRKRNNKNIGLSFPLPSLFLYSSYTNPPSTWEGLKFTSNFPVYVVWPQSRLV